MAVAVVAILSIVGFLSARAGHAGVDQIIEGKTDVKIDIFFIGLKTLDTDIFKPGEKSALTIRNRPVEPPMVITQVEHWPHKASFLSQDGKSAVAFPDPAMDLKPGVPLAHDFLVSLQEVAEKTKDGYVVSGNKVKIGNQVELEAMKYRATGVVVDISEVKKQEGAPQ